MRRDIREELRSSLSEDNLKLVPRSFDIIGSKQKAIAIIEMPQELKKFENMIAEAIMRVNRNVASILVKESKRVGELRLRNYRLVAGDTNTEVVHKESGSVFKLDPRKVYFSPRECGERERIESKVNYGENILVMFSGVGPFPIRIAKKHKQIRVIAVELNPYAHNFCVENIHLNRVGDRVKAILGDVKNICPQFGKIFTRIIMPLPKGAYRFLNVAVPLMRGGGVLHFYHWASEPDLFAQAENLINSAAEENGRSVEILERVKVSQFSPRVWKIRVDAQILV